MNTSPELAAQAEWLHPGLANAATRRPFKTPVRLKRQG